MKSPWPAARSCASFRRRSTVFRLVPGCGSRSRASVPVRWAASKPCHLPTRWSVRFAARNCYWTWNGGPFDDGTAAHEMIHLLAANSGLLPHHSAFPIWLQEGIAMQFEVVRGGRWAGIGRANDLRLPDWRRIQPSPRLEPLVRDLGFGRGYQRDLYAQSWSLVFFLRSRHSSQFLTFLDLLRSSDDTLSELAPADRWLAVFQRLSAPTSTPWSTSGLNSCPPSRARWNATPRDPRTRRPPGPNLHEHQR